MVVDVVGAEDDDVLRPLVVDQVEVLQDGVRRPEEPPLAQPLLRRYGRDVVAQQVRQPPGLGDVAVEAVRLVLRQHRDAQVSRVHQVGQGEVDEPVNRTERHRRLGSVRGERHQPLALTTGQHEPENLGLSPPAPKIAVARCAGHVHLSLSDGRVVRHDRRGTAGQWPGAE
jgi:hypothetical protein